MYEYSTYMVTYIIGAAGLLPPKKKKKKKKNLHLCATLDLTPSLLAFPPWPLSPSPPPPPPPPAIRRWTKRHRFDFSKLIEQLCPFFLFFGDSKTG